MSKKLDEDISSYESPNEISRSEARSMLQRRSVPGVQQDASTGQRFRSWDSELVTVGDIIDQAIASIDAG